MGLDNFTLREARPLPVIILADTSGSMSQNGKIQALNRAIREMLDSFAGEDDSNVAIQVGVVCFGGQAELHTDLQPAADIDWQNMGASGGTPMGAAFDLVRQMVEDQDCIPSRAYRPTLVLVSDGHPTDNWNSALEKLVASERASKADRFAMGIGTDTDTQVLEKFIKNDLELDVFSAADAADIRKFFQFVTMSVTTRSRSANPNIQPESIEGDLDDFVF